MRTSHVIQLTFCAMLGAVTASCADPAAPGRHSDESIRVRAATLDLEPGGRTSLVALSGGRALAAADVRWESRDPSTVMLRGSEAMAVAPGATFVVARRGAFADSVRLTVRPAAVATLPPAPSDDDPPLETAPPGPPVGPLRLVGAAMWTEYWHETPYETIHGFATAIVASSGPAEFRNGEPVRVSGDTILQINYRGSPAVGPRAVQPPHVAITHDLFRRGEDDVVLLVHEGSWRMRFFVQAAPAVLEITALTPPAPGRLGEIRGRITFHAAEYLRDLGPGGGITVTRVSAALRVVSAEFASPMAYRERRFGG